MFHRADSHGPVSASPNVLARRRGVVDLLAACLFLMWAAERPVLAYIDPGSGALLWQAMLAGFFGALFYFRKFLARFSFRRKDVKSETHLDSE